MVLEFQNQKILLYQYFLDKYFSLNKGEISQMRTRLTFFQEKRKYWYFTKKISGTRTKSDQEKPVCIPVFRLQLT